MVNVSIFGYISICEVLVNYENATIQGVLGSKIKELERSEYLPIRIDGNTTGSQYCANLMNDGFSGIDQSKVTKNKVDTIINCKNHYKSVNIDQLLYLYKPDIIGSIVLWSHIDTSLISCNITLYTNITILMYTNSKHTEPCSEKLNTSITKDNLLLIYANCSKDSKNKIKSVSIQISNWTGGQITEIALYSKFMIYESDRGNLFYFNIV